MTERFHLVACAAWCISIGGILWLAPTDTALPRWPFALMGLSGIAGLMKAASGVALRKPSARY